jgi:hypothetical protein
LFAVYVNVCASATQQRENLIKKTLSNYDSIKRLHAKHSPLLAKNRESNIGAIIQNISACRSTTV